MYAIVLSYTTNDIITAVLVCAVAHMTRKNVIMRVKYMDMGNSHDKGLC